MSNHQHATPVLTSATHAAEFGISAEDWTAHYYANPQGEIWRDSRGNLLHDCGKCGRPRKLDECECEIP